LCRSGSAVEPDITNDSKKTFQVNVTPNSTPQKETGQAEESANKKHPIFYRIAHFNPANKKLIAIRT